MTTENVKSFLEMNTVELLESFNSGQGKTVDLPSFASFSDDNTITYNGMSATVTEAWTKAYVLMQLHSALKDAPVDRQSKVFSAYGEGRLALTHRHGEASKPLTGHYLTSEDYYANMVRQSATYDNVNTIIELVTTAINNPKTTKESLLQTLQAIETLITPTPKMDVYVTLREKEEALNSIKATLADLVSDITLTSEKSFTVSVTSANIDKVVSLAVEKGFQFVSATAPTFKDGQMSMTVSFTQL